MNIFHKTFQDKILTFFETPESFTDSFCSHIYQIIDKSGAKANPLLVGEIKDEYFLHLSQIDNFYIEHFEKAIYTHIKSQTDISLTESFPPDIKIMINTCWLNVMKPNEFNPAHIHENNELNFIFFLNDYDVHKEVSVARERNARFFDLQTQTMQFEGSFKGCHVIIRNDEIMNIIPAKNFGIVYDWNLVHQVYPFDQNKERLTFVMNINIQEVSKNQRRHVGYWDHMKNVGIKLNEL